MTTVTSSFSAPPQGPFLAWDHMRQELMQLLAITFSYDAISDAGETCLTGEWKSFWQLLDRHTAELQRCFLSVAVLVRSHDDHFDREWRKSPDFSKGGCGTLTWLGPPRRDEELDLREACNKIIHADQWTVKLRHRQVRKGPDGKEREILLPTLVLSGTEPRRGIWEAELRVFNFVVQASTLLRGG